MIEHIARDSTAIHARQRLPEDAKKAAPADAARIPMFAKQTSTGRPETISCFLTGAAVHDWQVAIPLMQMSTERVRWKCETMDSAYDAKLIRQHSQKLGHEALIKPNISHARSARENAFTEEQKQHFQKHTIVEQLNGRLQDEFGGRTIYVKGASKIMAHFMFGVVGLRSISCFAQLLEAFAFAIL